MIKSLFLHNFRTHEDTVLDFSPKVNIIVGPSDAGKSNIIRALNWIVNNRPLGQNVLRHGEEQVDAEVVIEQDKKEISVFRIKGKNLNAYSVAVDGREVDFTSFGSSPPQEVHETLNLSSINIQKQNEQYFLVFESPGKVASYIRSVTRLDEIDQVVKLLSSKIRAEKSEIAVYRDELEEVEGALEEIAKINLEKLEKDLSNARCLLKDKEEVERSKSDLHSLLRDLEDIESSFITLPDNIDSILVDAKKVSQKFRDANDEINEITAIINELEKIEQAKICIADDLAVFSKADLASQEYNNVYKEVEILGSLLERLVEVEKEVEKMSEQLSSALEDEKRLMEKLDRCPMCGQQLTAKAKEILLVHPFQNLTVLPLS